MVYKPTGRPPGRPKSKDYVTLMARVPQELAEQVQRYARLHRQSVSDMLRDGLQLLLNTEDDAAYFMYDRNPTSGILSDSNPTIGSAGPEMMSDRNASPEDTAPERMAAIPQSPGTVQEEEEMMSDINTTPERVQEAGIMSDTNPAPAVAYDVEKYFLGPLCRQGHDWQGTGQSLRRRSAETTGRECLECQRLRQARKRQRQGTAD